MSVSEYIFIDFSSRDYGKLVELKPPIACSVYSEVDNTIVYASKCESKGNRLSIALELSIPLNTKFVLLIQGMTNMEASSCFIRIPQLL